MGVLPCRLLACVLVVAFLATSLRCTCADGADDAARPLAACAAEGCPQDLDHGAHHAPDTCRCVAHMRYLSDSAGTPDLAVATAALPSGAALPEVGAAASVGLGAGSLPRRALTPWRPERTSLLRQHCALTV